MKPKWMLIGVLLLAIPLFLFYRFPASQPDPFIVPIEQINSYQIPCTSIEIEGNCYQVEIDLGTKTPLSLSSETLRKVKKHLCGTARRLDFQGNKYETPLYLIPLVKLGDNCLKNIKAKEESEEFSTKGSIVCESREAPKVGRIGRDFFQKKHLLIDIKNQILIASDREKELSQTSPAIPFKVTSDGWTVEVQTDLGKRTFGIDTGTTLSVIRSEPFKGTCIEEKNGMRFIQTEQFSIGGSDFGPRVLLILPISPQFDEIDGLLGMDFLKDHKVYLDFPAKRLMIEKNGEAEKVDDHER